MSGTITYVCSGCDNVATVEWRTEVTHRPVSKDIDRRETRLPLIRESAPEGWITVDPYTSATYCPTCWTGITTPGDVVPVTIGAR